MSQRSAIVIGGGIGGLATAAGLLRTGWRWLVRTTIDQLTARQGLPAYALHRSDLHTVLLNAAQGADLRTGCTVTGVATGADQAEVGYVATGGASDTAPADYRPTPRTTDASSSSGTSGLNRACG